MRTVCNFLSKTRADSQQNFVRYAEDATYGGSHIYPRLYDNYNQRKLFSYLEQKYACEMCDGRIQ